MRWDGESSAMEVAERRGEFERTDVEGPEATTSDYLTVEEIRALPTLAELLRRPT